MGIEVFSLYKIRRDPNKFIVFALQCKAEKGGLALLKCLIRTSFHFKDQWIYSPLEFQTELRANGFPKLAIYVQEQVEKGDYE